MSRRLEITVPMDWSPPVRAILEKECGLNASSGKAYMMTELSGKENTVFLIVIPGPAVSGILEALRKNGVGTSVGRIILSTIDYLKPDLAAPLVKPQLTLEEMKQDGNKPPPLKSFQHFKRARKTTEEMYNEISNNTNTTINTWMNLIGASTMAAGGLTTNVLVFTVAAMLVSPIMGPILGMVMGYRVADFNLFRTGFFNELKMAIVTYLTGCFFGTLLGDVGKTYKWPNSQMMHEGMAFNLVISIIVSAAAGMVLGISMTAAGGNALVGTAISAGLLPPLVNAGMLHAYASFYVTDPDRQGLFYEIGTYSILFYATHVITIVIVANFVFYLKDVDPRFREGEDANIQLLTDYRKTLTEREKAELFIGNIKADLKKDVKVLTEGVKDFFSGNITIGREGIVNRRTGEKGGHSSNSSNKNASRRTAKQRKSTDSSFSASFNSSSGGVARGGEDYEMGEEDAHEEEQDEEEEGREDDEEKNLLHRNTRPSDHRGYTKHHSSSYRNTSASGKGKTTVEPSYMTASAAALEEGTLGNDNHTNKNNNSSSIEMTTPSTPTSSKSMSGLSPREQVIQFYRRYNPSKVSTVDEILLKYEGREDELLRRLRKQYSVSMPEGGK